jgi:hypothetical protein
MIKLQEKVFKFERTINSIFKLYFDPVYDSLENKEDWFIKEVKTAILNGEEILIKRLSSSDISYDPVIREASKKKPIQILIGFFYGDSTYSVDDQEVKASIIDMTTLKELNTIGYFEKDMSMEDAKNNIKNKFKGRSLPLALSLERDNAKLLLAHELSHWLLDALVFDYIDDFEKYYMKLVRKGEDSDTSLVTLFYAETDAQIHEIATMKNLYSEEEWGTFTFEDIVSKSSSLVAIYKFLSISSLDYFGRWKTYLLLRMSREDLLGKNMNKKGDPYKIFEKVKRHPCFCHSAERYFYDYDFIHKKTKYKLTKDKERIK